MTRMPRTSGMLWAALAGVGFAAACGSSGVVGGTCRPSYCAGSGGSSAASAGSAGAGDSSATAGSSTAAGQANEAGAGNSNGGSNGSDASPDAPSDGSQNGDASCGPVPYDRPEACGDCATQCTGDTPICSPDGMGNFSCVKECQDPLTLCGDQCVNLNIDPMHCGSCPNVCPSGICQGGMCVGANVGHVVLACMDYSTPVANSPQTVLLGNAVFLPIRNPVRVLAYTQYAPVAARTKVNQDIGFGATARGRMYAITASATDADVTAKLNVSDYDVFLIYDQITAPAGQLGTIGAAWQASTVLSSFAAAGGVIVALTGGGENSEMGQLFTNAGLLDVSAQTSAASVTLYNRAPADALGINVISPFLAPQSSCTFTTGTTPDADDIFVIRDAPAPAQGAPVVVHRVIEP